MGDTIGIVLMLCNVGIFVALALQIHAYLRGGTIISARQLGARVVCGVLLIVIITMIYYGLAHKWTDPVHALIFWAVMMFLAMLLFVVALMSGRFMGGNGSEMSSNAMVSFIPGLSSPASTAFGRSLI